MSIGNIDAASYKQISATATITGTPGGNANSSGGQTGGVIKGFFVSSTSSGTITIYDSATTTTTTKIIDTITPTTLGYYSINAIYNNGIYVVIGGSALSVTILYV